LKVTLPFVLVGNGINMMFRIMPRTAKAVGGEDVILQIYQILGQILLITVGQVCFV
jgi:hypothetical protein